MVLSKKRKIYVGLLALAAIGLIVDRMVLAPSEMAPAESVASPMPSRSEDSAPKAPALLQAARQTGARQASGPSLAERLQALAEARDLELANVKNAFRTAEPWGVELRTPKPAVIQDDTARIEKFCRDHRLMAVMVASDGGRAIVDGKSYRIGQQLDGFRLISVTERTAVWASGTRRATLTLPVDPSRTGEPE